MMEGKATAEEQAAKSALGRRTKSIRRKLRRGRADESGLTTLEWLLIVAAVAGLAALAVVLVQGVVDETAEQITDSSARLTAAKLAGNRITNKAAADPPTDDTLTAAIFLARSNEYKEDCDRLKITYGDIDDLAVNWEYMAPGTFTAETWLEAFNDPVTEGCLVKVT